MNLEQAKATLARYGDTKNREGREPIEVTEAKNFIDAHDRQEEANRIAAEQASHKAKIGRGPIATKAEASDVRQRLRKMGVPEKDLRAAQKTFANALKEYEIRPYTTEEEFLDQLKVHKYPKAERDSMQKYLKQIYPIVAADVGITDPTEPFSDASSLRNYLIANHYPDSEIPNIESKAATASGHFELPEDVRNQIQDQNYQHEVARAERARKEDPDEIIHDIVEKHDENTIEGAHREKAPEELAVAGARMMVKGLPRGAFKSKLEHQIPRTKEELLADERILKMDPNNPAALARKKALEDVVRNNLGEKGIQKAADPYMKNASADFVKRHQELFGDIEKKQRDTAGKFWQEQLEKANPGFSAKYITPGVAGHGHIEKERQEYQRKSQEATERLLQENEAANRRASMQATLEEQANQGRLAGQAGALAKNDIDAEISGINSLEAIQDNQEAKVLNNAVQVGKIGEEKRAMAQEERNAKITEARDEHDFFHKRGTEFLNAAGVGNIEYQPEKNLIYPQHPGAHGMADTAKGLWGAGAAALQHRFDKPKKEGGRVHRAAGGSISSSVHTKYVTPRAMIGYLQAKSAHQRLASGGSVDPNFMQDAVFDGVLPSTELRAQVRRKVLNQAKDDYDAKSRNHLATGGTVAPNPIMTGADMAKSFVESERDKQMNEKAHAARMDIMNPKVEEQPSLFKTLATGFMRGAATGTGSLAEGGKAFMAVHDAQEAEEKAKRDRDREQKKLIMDVNDQYTNQRNQEKKLILDKSGHDLALKKQAFDELVGASTIGVNEAHKDLYTAQADKLAQGYGINGEDPSENPTKPQTKETQKAISKAKDLMTAANNASLHLDHIEENILNSDTGKAVSMLSGIPSFGLGNWAASKIAGSTTEDIGSFDSNSKEAVSALINLESKRGEFKGNKAASATNAAVEGKFGLGLEKPVNIKKTIGWRTEIVNDLKFALDEAKRNGASIKEQNEILESIETEQIKIASLNKSLSATNPGKKAAKLNKLDKLIAKKEAQEKDRKYG